MLFLFLPRLIPATGVVFPPPIVARPGNVGQSANNGGSSLAPSLQGGGLTANITGKVED